ncbi:MAG: acyl-CoA/acyl-ACP dehydrogenase [Mycobacterium sp.]|nr:acyl-CoA/acyl-ACP dehydrogenase [Mycobacterium sp.]
MTTFEERQLLRQSVAALVSKHATSEANRRAMDSVTGYDEALWSMLCEQVGVAALVVPEEIGGAGGELADAAAVLEELGRALVPTPLLGTTLAELALLAADEPDGETIERLAAGTAIGAVVFDRDYVINGDVADVVLAVDDARIVRWAEVSIAAAHTLDPTRRLARVTPGACTTIGNDPGIADTASILLAAEQVGAAARCLELTVEYTKQRVQFGRPIGSFQALKHRMADMYVAVQSARAVVGEAVASPTPISAALARLAASDAFCSVAGEAIQLHGGIAITWEHDMQLYFKRAHSSAQLLGPPREQLRRLESEVF